MDVLVQQAQKYLNETYSGRAGYVPVVEDGFTGWSTVYAVLRALQIELGIATPVNNYGTGTDAAFTSQIGTLGSAGTHPEIVSILRCALWCKGYYGGTIPNDWDDALSASIASMQSDLGLPPTAGVNSKLMKSILTMDAYVLLPGGAPEIRAGQQWLNGRYSDRKNFQLVPCDGLFTRQVQTGLLYAIQFELGMSDDVANGNFGPGTTAGLQEKAHLVSGNTDGSHSFVKLFQIALACNKRSIEVNGNFDGATVQETQGFQDFMEISITGEADFPTWAALLVSTGDPNRPVSGFDTSTPLTASAAVSRFVEGYRVVGRYLTVAQKAIAPGEIENIFGAGLNLFPIFQNFNNAASYFSYDSGYNHGRQAAIRARELGLASTDIFFAVDYDASGDEASTIIRDYFEGVRDGLACSVAVRYSVGIYATRNICAIIRSADLTVAIWVSGLSIGYSGNLGFPMPDDWHYNQIQEIKLLNIDRNAVSDRARPLRPGDVVTPPLTGTQFNPLYWGLKLEGPDEIFGLMKLQVMAEESVQQSGWIASDAQFSEMASNFVMYWFQQEEYSQDVEGWTGVLWAVYTAPLEAISLIMPEYLPLVKARDRFFVNAGSSLNKVHALDVYYDGGDLDHAMATAHGVRIWGNHAGSSEIGKGDLGGWALDVVQLYANFVDSGTSLPRADWFKQNLGASGGFGLSDVIADADGWLTGRMLSQGATLGQAWRDILRSYPTWQDRWSAFISGRFGADASLTLEGALTHLLTANGIDYVGFARDQFLPDDVPVPDPTAAVEIAKDIAVAMLTLVENS